jgi:hypothetical protein
MSSSSSEASSPEETQISLPELSKKFYELACHPFEGLIALKDDIDGQSVGEANRSRKPKSVETLLTKIRNLQWQASDAYERVFGRADDEENLPSTILINKTAQEVRSEYNEYRRQYEEWMFACGPLLQYGKVTQAVQEIVKYLNEYASICAKYALEKDDVESQEEYRERVKTAEAGAMKVCEGAKEFTGAE